MLCAIAGMALLAGSAATAATTSTAPTVSGVPEVGATLTATPVTATDTINWETCDDQGNQVGTAYLATDTTTYTLAASDASTYVCAVELVSGVATYTSVPVGLIGSGPSLSSTTPVQGQPLTVTPGAGPSSGEQITEAWSDCDSFDVSCGSITGATGLSYTPVRSDADQTLEVVQTVIDGGASFTSPALFTGLVTATAPTPSSTNPPTVSGTPQVGETLTASHGSWSNDPTSYAYSWQRCSSESCTSIPNATGATYVVGTTDIGSSLEVLVTASVFSSQGIPYPSYPTDVVPAATTTTGTTGTTSGSSGSTATSPVTHTDTSKKLLGRLTPTMQWTFRYTPSYTQVIALDSDGTAIGATVTVRCAGKGCPFTKRRDAVTQSKQCGADDTHACRSSKTVDLEPDFRGHRLRVGARVTVTITRRRYDGKYFRFTVRARKQPAVRISCLAPGSSVPGKGC